MKPPRRLSPNRRKLMLAASASLCGGALSAGAQPSATTPTTATMASATMQTLLQGRVQVEGVGLAAFHLGAQGPHFAAAGRSGLASMPGLDATARFEWGSITKTLTALLLAQMVTTRELTLADAVEAALPSGTRFRDAQGQPITWLDLATHRSGLPRLPDNLRPKQPADPYADFGEEQLTEFLANWKPEVARQARHTYSNLGYGLLGHALGRRDGRGFATALTERVLKPLGLEGVVLSTPGIGVARAVQGHDAQGQPVLPWRFKVLAGAGAAVGSVQELARYAQAALGLFPHPLQEAFALALQRHADGVGPYNPQGLGWLLGPVSGRTVFNHDGGTFGFSSSLFLDPAKRQASGVLANAFVVVNDLALHLIEPAAPLRDPAAERAAAQATATRETLALAPGAVAILTGTYALNPQFKLSLRADGARLFARATGQGEFELFASAQRQFFARVAPIEVNFEGTEGAPPALVLLQAGQRLRFVRE